MANKIEYTPKTVDSRHGQKGYVVLRCEIPHDTKVALASLAEERNVTLKSVYNEAFNWYIMEYTV